MEDAYEDGSTFICADCGHEWPRVGAAVVLIKDLKVKGSSITLKMGSKVKSIRLVGGDHEVDCKVDGGSFMLKACYLKKV